MIPSHIVSSRQYSQRFSLLQLYICEGALQFKLMTGFNTGKAYSRSGKFASQAVEHVRTVASLGRLNAFVDEYFRTLEYPIKVR